VSSAITERLAEIEEINKPSEQVEQLLELAGSFVALFFRGVPTGIGCRRKD